eukprot:scpid104573/ scgid31033/ 
MYSNPRDSAVHVLDNAVVVHLSNHGQVVHLSNHGQVVHLGNHGHSHVHTCTVARTQARHETMQSLRVPPDFAAHSSVVTSSLMPGCRHVELLLSHHGYDIMAMTSWL